MQLRGRGGERRRTGCPIRRPPMAMRGWGGSWTSLRSWGWPYCLPCGRWAILPGSGSRRSRSRRRLTCFPARLCPSPILWPASHQVSSSLFNAGYLALGWLIGRFQSIVWIIDLQFNQLGGIRWEASAAQRSPVETGNQEPKEETGNLFQWPSQRPAPLNRHWGDSSSIESQSFHAGEAWPSTGRYWHQSSASQSNNPPPSSRLV